MNNKKGRDKTMKKTTHSYKEILQENKDLKIKIKILKEAVEQFDFLKTDYDNLLKNLKKENMHNKDDIEKIVNKKIGNIKDVNKNLKKELTELETISNYDTLTKLRNRRNYNKILDELIGKAILEDVNFILIVFDVDNFKKYNDTYGHDSGDIVLSELGKTFNKFSKRNDEYFFRYGGEEFVYTTIGKNKKEILNLCEAIKNDLENKKIKHIHNTTGYVTISMGTIIITPNNIFNYKDNFFEIADKNLYNSKDTGRNKNTITVV